MDLRVSFAEEFPERSITLEPHFPMPGAVLRGRTQGHPFFENKLKPVAFLEPVPIRSPLREHFLGHADSIVLGQSPEPLVEHPMSIPGEC